MRASMCAAAGSSAWAKRARTASASSTRSPRWTQHPESVPVNALVPVKGTVLGDMLADTPLAKIDDIEFVRTVAVARITMPMSMVRLSAGRESMSEATQALCFMAGANSIFTGDKLLTAPNAGDDSDARAVREAGADGRWRQEEPMRACTGKRNRRSEYGRHALHPGLARKVR